MKKISSRDYLAGLRIHLLPFVVWMGAIACVVVLFSHRSRRYEVIGIAQGPIHQLAATCDGRLKNVGVELFDEVKQGQVLAVIDGVLDNERPRPELDAELAVLKAQMAQLAAESKVARAIYTAQVNNRVSGWTADLRPFATNVSDARLRVLELTAAVETDRLALRQLDLDIKRFVLEGRLDANDVAIYDLQKMRAQKSAVEQRIVSNASLLEQANADLALAIEREKAFAQGEPDAAGADQAAEDALNKQTEVLARQMDEVLVRLDSLTRRESVELRAPFDGVVSLVQHTAGEAVLAGEPILTIAKKEPENIVAYATEKQVSRVQENTVVQLIDRNSTPNLMVDSQVVYVGPTVEQMPARLWRNPNIPQWGRPVLVKIPPSLKLVPGAVVGVRGI
jgi:multidrug resistance efflux pump